MQSSGLLHHKWTVSVGCHALRTVQSTGDVTTDGPGPGWYAEGDLPGLLG